MAARSEPVELFSQRKVLIRQSAGIVRRERKRHLVPADVNVGMMPRLPGESGDGVHKFDGGGKILELKRAEIAERCFFQPGVLASADLIWTGVSFFMA